MSQHPGQFLVLAGVRQFAVDFRHLLRAPRDAVDGGLSAPANDVP
jgi:hypothetical protein